MVKAIIFYKDFNKAEQIDRCERYAKLSNFEVVKEINDIELAKVYALTKDYDVLLFDNITNLGSSPDDVSKNIVAIRNKGIRIIEATEKKIKKLEQ